MATDLNAFANPQLALALGLAAVFSGRSAIVFGSTSESINEYLDYSRPEISFDAHYLVGFGTDLEGQTVELTFSSGFAMPGLTVEVTGGFEVGNLLSSPIGLALMVPRLLSDFLLGGTKCFIAGTPI